LSDWIEFQSDPRHIAREREKVRALRKTQWWLNKIARGECHYCKKIFSPEELTMDHIVPLARGGKTKRGNVVPCCKSCNNEKKYYTPVDIILKQMNEGESK